MTYFLCHPLLFKLYFKDSCDTDIPQKGFVWSVAIAVHLQSLNIIHQTINKLARNNEVLYKELAKRNTNTLHHSTS